VPLGRTKDQVGLTKMKIAILLLGCSLLLTAVSCNKKSTESASQAGTKHYHLKGKVVSIDTRAKMLNVDSESIPGFMDAMIMPYKVKPESELEKLYPGDAITADLLVQDEGEGASLENIAVIGHSPAGQNK
jgi:protein SCO1